jgi:hypothetical protein
MRIRTPAVAATCCLLVGLCALPAAAPAKKARKAPTRTVFGGVLSTGAPAQLLLTPNGKAVDHMLLFVEGKCSDGTTITYDTRLDFQRMVPAFVPPGEHVLAGGRLSRSGAFSGDGGGTDGFGEDSGAMQETVTGKVTRSGTASGTYSAQITLTDANGNAAGTCDIPKLRWTARSAAGRVFAGITSGGLPIVVEVDRAGRKVQTARFGLRAPCTPATSGILYLADSLTNLAVSRAGAFADTFQSEFPVQSGGKVVVDYAISGRLKAKRASGSFSIKATQTDAAGAQVDVCDTGRITFKATSG